MSFELASSIALIYRLVFFALLFVFTCHASFMIYHWFTYGASATISRYASAAYLFISLILFGVLGTVAFL